MLRLTYPEANVGFLIDTTALSAYMNQEHQHHDSTVAVVDRLPESAPKLVSIVTLAEFDYGIRLAEMNGSTRLNEYRQRLSVVRNYAPLEMTRHTGEAYAAIKSSLAARVQKKPGKKMRRWIEDWVALGSGKELQIDENDLSIAAQTKERDLVIVTGDNDMRVLSSVDSEIRILFTRS